MLRSSWGAADVALAIEVRALVCGETVSGRVYVVKRNTRWLFRSGTTPPMYLGVSTVGEATHCASEAEASQLLAAATMASAGENVFAVEAYALVEADTTLDAAHVTPRQREVLKHMARGLGNDAIARKLGISPHTVKFHTTEILFVLGARSRTEAVVQALRSGIIT